MLIYWCVSLFHLLLNNTNCDLWFHYFYRSKLLGGGGGGGECVKCCLVKPASTTCLKYYFYFSLHRLITKGISKSSKQFQPTTPCCFRGTNII